MEILDKDISQEGGSLGEKHIHREVELSEP